MAESHDPRPAAEERPRGPQLLLGFLFGIVFGWLLQKAGVAKYEILMNGLLLRDFTVIKVMLTAIVVGMFGIWLLHRMGAVKLHIPPTRYAANIVGGLIFGVGFALSGYCPGTGAAALGQGNWDAIAVIAGMILGSYVYAEVYPQLKRGLESRGVCGTVTLPEKCGVRQLPFMLALACLILLAFYGLERL